MSKKSKKSNKQEKTTPETAGHKVGWLALFAVLSIVGAVVWFVMNADDI